MSEKPAKKESTRLVFLDYLRGFFIVVIVIDHLGRWPSLLEFFTGRGTLWVNAAFGFVIISGLLIGYVRGYKNRREPFSVILKKILPRSLLLYLWLVIGTVVYAAITWYVTNKDLLAWVEIPVGDWGTLVVSALTFAYTNNWVHFLALYSLFLLVSPIALYLFRKRLAWIVLLLSVATYVIGLLHNIEWLQWQILFFVPSIAGFYLENIARFWNRQNKARKSMIVSIFFSITLLTIIGSVITSRIMPESNFSILINTYFVHSPLSILSVTLSFFYFVAFILLFSKYEKGIGRYLGWLLHPLGTRSLTAYIVHPITLIICALFIGKSDSIIINTLLGIICVIGTWILVKQKIVQKIIPR